jgi:IclR family acetate operon transcriptional repressor
MTTQSRGGIQSLLRGFELLELMAADGGESSLTELANRSGLPLPTVHRIMRTLVGSDYVRQLPSRRYGLGPRLVGLGDAAANMVGVWARPWLTQLVDSVGESANLALLDGDHVMYVAQVPSRHAMRMFTEVGRRASVHATAVGKAILAGMPDEAVRDLVARTGLTPQTRHTITTANGLISELDRIRERGYAVDDEEQEDGVRCVAIAIRSASTRMAVSVSGPTGRITADSVDRIGSVLKDVVGSISTELEKQSVEIA